MPVQILMCPCYKDYFLQTGKAIISHLGNFHRKSAEKSHENVCSFLQGSSIWFDDT